MRPLAVALAALAALPLSAQSPDTPLPRDTAVIAGRLPNGLSYVVRRNTKPEKRAELRLVVNAGSVLEDDSQRGLAHFVEHMAFDGTRRFPKGDIVNFLERVGMRFGADVNAYTSFDETIYQLQVPTDSARLVGTALDILRDWANDVTFAPADMRKERGVVIEEWRTGRNASTRVSNRQFPVMLRGSAYAKRLPIGTKESLDTFADSDAVRFYREWYRPDLMTVVAVGDFDAREMQREIEARFASVPARPSERPRPVAAVPDHAATLVSIESDPEYAAKNVTLLWKLPHQPYKTLGDFRRSLVASFYDGMMNQRFSEMTQKPDAPFAFAESGRGAFVRTKDAYQLSAGVKESGFVAAADALLAESERVRRFGFTQGELDRQRTGYLRDLEQAYAERDKSESAGFADDYANDALTGTPMVSVADELALARAIAPGITLADVDALARSTFTDSNRVVLVAAPARADVKLPDEASLLVTFEKVKGERLAAYADSTSSAPLVPSPPAPGRIVAERTIAGTGITEWTLSNGATVFLKPTDFKADEVLLQGQAPGGISLLENADVTSALGADVVFGVSGLGTFSQVDLQKKLTGKKAMVQAGIGSTSATIEGSASRRDLETLFELTWLRYTQPRVDTGAWRAFSNQVKSAMANQRNQPARVFGDTITVTMAQHNPRTHLFGPEMVDSVDLGRALAIYRQRFANAGAFHFFLVGSFSPDSVRPLVERWIASLPGTPARDRVVDRGVRPPPGVVTRVVHKGIEPKATTRLIFTGPCHYSFEERITLSALEELLSIRLREVLREDKGGTYGVGVSASCSHIPYERSRVDISFGSAPERVDELVAATYAVLDSVKAGAISDSNLVKVHEILRREHEDALKQNESWLGAMADADEDGRDVADWLRVPEIVSSITRERLRDAARAVLDPRQVARFTLLPETPAVHAPAQPRP
ncbi:MAG: insulinase family protein [Gemmatimonadetes bacterium]|nr:insulinase family protein [Gemmatimonadota bacterium]